MGVFIHIHTLIIPRTPSVPTNLSISSRKRTQFRPYMLRQLSNLESASLTPWKHVRESCQPRGPSFRLRPEVRPGLRFLSSLVYRLFCGASGSTRRLRRRHSLPPRLHSAPAHMTTRSPTWPYCHRREHPGATYRYSTFDSAAPPYAKYSFLTLLARHRKPVFPTPRGEQQS